MALSVTTDCRRFVWHIHTCGSGWMSLLSRHQRRQHQRDVIALTTDSITVAPEIKCQPRNKTRLMCVRPKSRLEQAGYGSTDVTVTQRGKGV